MPFAATAAAATGYNQRVRRCPTTSQAKRQKIRRPALPDVRGHGVHAARAGAEITPAPTPAPCGVIRAARPDDGRAGNSRSVWLPTEDSRDAAPKAIQRLSAILTATTTTGARERRLSIRGPPSRCEALVSVLSAVQSANDGVYEVNFDNPNAILPIASILRPSRRSPTAEPTRGPTNHASPRGSPRRSAPEKNRDAI